MTDKTSDKSGVSGFHDVEERIRQRLLAVEREAAWLRSRVRLLGIGLLFTLALGAFGAFSQGLPGLSDRTRDLETLTAERIVLRDASGTPRGEWRVDEEGNARLGLLDRQGRTRLSLSVLSGGSPGMSLINQNGQRRAGLALLPDESTNMTFADGAGLPRVVLGLSTGDAAQLVFADGSGRPLVALGLDEAGFGTVVLPEEPDSGEEIGGT
jgi:hypothetical protein